jgi:ribosome recycling factor
VPLSQVAQLSLLDARTIGVQPWEKPMISKVEKAIRESDLGLNPSTTGDIIRVPMPALTEERRKELIKVARHKAEEGRVSIRNIRRHAKDSLDKLVKDGEVGEDDVVRAEKELEKLTHTYVGQVDEALSSKEAELLEV